MNDMKLKMIEGLETTWAGLKPGETTFHRVAPYFIPELWNIEETITTLKATGEALESCFALQMVKCFFDDDGGYYDHQKLTDLIKARVTELRTLIKHGLMRD